jgi:dihydroxyacetone kinase-like predicted kinase
MTTATMLDAAALARVVVAYRDVLVVHREILNRCNVYPVPDGDTGTNMSLTLDAVCGEVADRSGRATMAEVCGAIAHGSLMGARGNSGVILSQALRAMSETFGGCGGLRAGT